jgi:spore maturation protein CgeB
VDLYAKLQPQIINLYEDNELGRSKLDTLLDTYREEIAENNKLWSTAWVYGAYEHIPVDGTYEGEIEYLRSWLKNRNEFIYNYYCAEEN